MGNKDGKLFNAAVFVLAKVIKNVMASAAEAEVGALFMNGHKKKLFPLKTASSIWGTHNQLPK